MLVKRVSIIGILLIYRYKKTCVS